MNISSEKKFIENYKHVKNCSEHYARVKYLHGLNKFGTGPIKKYRFYDDDRNNIQKMKEDERIQSILVKRRPLQSNTIGLYDNYHINKSIYYREHIEYVYDINGKDADIKNYIEIRRGLKNEDEHHVSEGLDILMLNELKEWADLLYQQEIQTEQQEYIGCVFFDFDRVLNCLEGITITRNLNDFKTIYNIEPYGILKYIFGSKERYDSIYYTIDYLLQRKIKVCILTNNTACDSHPSFKELLGYYHNYFREYPDRIYCSVTYPSKLEFLHQNNLIS